MGPCKRGRIGNRLRTLARMLIPVRTGPDSAARTESRLQAGDDRAGTVDPRSYRPDRRRAAVRHALQPELLARRSHDGARDAPVASARCCTRSTSTRPRRRCTSSSRGCGRRCSAPARRGCARCRRCSGPLAIPIAYVCGRELVSRGGWAGRRGAGRAQPVHDLVLAGGQVLHAVHGPVRAVVLVLRPLAARPVAPQPGLVGGVPRRGGPHALLRRVPGRARGGVAGAGAAAGARR